MTSTITANVQICVGAVADQIKAVFMYETASQIVVSTTQYQYFCYKHSNQRSIGIKVYNSDINDVYRESLFENNLMLQITILSITLLRHQIATSDC